MSNKLDGYEVLSIIGSGSYGICKKVRRKYDGKIRVWKELDYGTMCDSEKQLLVSEVNLLRELKHENIVRYYDRIIDKVSTKIYIVMEYCEGGDLAKYISKHKKERSYIEENFIWKAIFQLSSALKACHNCAKAGNTILHRDLKPANIFLDGMNNCKLGDFGLARVLHHDTSFAKSFVGTPYYMSPELVNRSHYNEKSDIWSLGCLIYELCALAPPFLAANQNLLALKIQDGHFKPIPAHYSKDIQRIIEKTLTVKELLRPSIEDILESQLLKNNVRSLPEFDKLNHLSKEDILYIREKQLDDREKELYKREQLLLERERIADQKLASVERAMHNYQLRNNKENYTRINPMKTFESANVFKKSITQGQRPLRYLDNKIHLNLK